MSKKTGRNWKTRISSTCFW